MTGHHGTAGYENRGNIDSGRSHQQAGHIFITVRHTYQTIKSVRYCHAFGTVRNQIPCHKGIFHPDMSHGNTVTHSDGREYHRCAAGHCHPQFHRFHNFIQVHMSRNDLIIGTYNPDQGTFALFLCKPQGIQQASVRRLLYAFFYGITSHLLLPPSKCSAISLPIS